MILENTKKPLGTLVLDMAGQNLTNAFAALGGAVALDDLLGVADSLEVINPQSIPIQLQITKAAAPQPVKNISCGFGLGKESVGVPVASGDTFKVKSLGANVTSGILVLNFFRTV